LFNTDFATKTTDNLTIGTTYKYYLSSFFTSDFATKTTDIFNVGLTNKYYLSSLFTSDLATNSTTNLSEGTNLYYTSSRFNSAFATMNTTYLAEGTNWYYTSVMCDLDFALKNTDYLTQGTTNKYLNALSTTNSSDITHTYSTASPILSSVINNGCITPAKHSNGTAQNQVLLTGASPFTPSYSTLNTSMVSENSGFQYFTNTRAQAAVYNIASYVSTLNASGQITASAGINCAST